MEPPRPFPSLRRSSSAPASASNAGKQIADEEEVGRSCEQRWCPDTWQWYTWQQLREKYNARWGVESVLDHWEWKMQKPGAEIDESSQPDASFAALRFPHGIVRLFEFGRTRTGRYLVFKPPGFGKCDVRWPVLIFLHGHHEINKPDKVASLFVGRAREFDEFALSNFYIIAPLAEWDSILLHPDNHQFDIDNLAHAIVVATTRETEHLDFQRICVTGYSMGADAAASLAVKRGERLAAVALFAGSYPWADPSNSLPDGTNLEHLRNVQVRCFHNEADSYVGVERTQCLMNFFRHRLHYNAPTVRKILIPYPTSVLSFSQQVRAHAESTAYLNVRITELDGGSKSSWILKDAVHLADGHVCWPIVYASEPEFGLFHWMLSCNTSVPRPWPQVEDKTRLSPESVIKLLADLAEAYASNPLREAYVQLSALVGRDRFTFLLYAQQLAYVVQKPVLEKWKFHKAEAWVQMMAALSEHMMETELPAADEWRDKFQKKWDSVRRTLYGNMYHDCWSPSQERGNESPCLLPQAVVDRARGIGHPITPDKGKEMAVQLSQTLWRQRVKARSKAHKAEIKSSVPLLTVDQCLSLQEDLRNAFAQPEFQANLDLLRRSHAHEKTKFTMLRADAVFEAQVPVLTKYGFEGSRIGVEAMLSVLTEERFHDTPAFFRVSDECIMLIGMDEALLSAKTPEEIDAVRERVKMWKVWFKEGVWTGAVEDE